jgi:hypothetical protein
VLSLENENEEEDITKRSNKSFYNISELDVDLINTNNIEREKVE